MTYEAWQSARSGDAIPADPQAAAGSALLEDVSAVWSGAYRSPQRGRGGATCGF
jgi:hypothetical protein